MEVKPISNYIFVGTSLRFLQDVPTGFSIHGNGKILQNIDRFIEGIREFGLYVTISVSEKLIAFRTKISQTDQVAVLNENDTEELHKIITDIRTTLIAESKIKYIYIVTDKRLPIDKLLNNISELMAPNAFNKLSSIAQNDFKEAGLCIAFELPTAAAFYILRGTESVLRDLYYFCVKRKRLKRPMWGEIVIALKGRKINPLLLSNLDCIREYYRNPTDHPDKIYNIEEVQDLFSLCVDAIHKMIALMK
jgi:hypothetical protein